MVENILNNIKWFFRVVKEHFNIKVNNDITLKDYKGLTVMTFNIRRDNLKDGKNNWQYRKDAIVKMIEDVSPDIICMQEVMPHMAKYLKVQLSKYYDCKGLECFTGREITKSFCFVGEGLLTFYRKDRFDFIKKRKIRLFDGRKVNIRRACVVELFDNKTYKKYAVINTHFCHKSDEARYNSYCKLWDYYCKNVDVTFNNVYICGDFNSEVGQSKSGIDLFNRNFTYNQPDKDGTINFFSKGVGKTIDFIFSNEHYNASYVVRNEYDGKKFLSDHWPVVNYY